MLTKKATLFYWNLPLYSVYQVGNNFLLDYSLLAKHQVCLVATRALTNIHAPPSKRACNFGVSQQHWMWMGSREREKRSRATLSRGKQTVGIFKCDSNTTVEINSPVCVIAAGIQLRALLASTNTRNSRVHRDKLCVVSQRATKLLQFLVCTCYVHSEFPKPRPRAMECSTRCHETHFSKIMLFISSYSVVINYTQLVPMENQKLLATTVFFSGIGPRCTNQIFIRDQYRESAACLGIFAQSIRWNQTLFLVLAAWRHWARKIMR